MPEIITVSNAIQNEVELAPHTTIGIGGNARHLIRCESLADVKFGVQTAQERKLPIFVLGGGSNLLVDDTGFHGMVLHMAIEGIDYQPVNDSGKTFVTVGAGVPWDTFVQSCVEHNLQGVECLSGIPGQVGASPIQNIGAYGQEVSDTIFSVQALEIATLDAVNFSNADCKFNYRMSRFKGEDANRYIVTAVTFQLKNDLPPQLRYADLQKYFAGTATPPTLAEVRNAVIQIRSEKGMVVRSSDPDSRSCGSFFMNPIVTHEERNRIRNIVDEKFGTEARFPEFPVPDRADGQKLVKLSAAWLMDKSGLQKGMRHKGAGLSSKHVLAIINANHATSKDVRELIQIVQETVQEQFRVMLHPEPVLLP